MKVLAVTTDYFDQVRSLFSGHEVSHLKMGDYIGASKQSADLVVFTGGADVNPEYYGVSRPKSGWFNLERDEWEMEILQFIRKGHLRCSKVLGICRGVQLMNVRFGGSLVYDIPTAFEGFSHPGIHALEWLYESPMSSIFPEVNSLHHQGLRTVGEVYPYDVLAKEPHTKIPEIVVWGNQFLGVQFHPEFMIRNPKIQEFVTLLENWTMKGTSLYTRSAGIASRMAAKKAVKSPVNYTISFDETQF